jgi:hypothetical protein
MHTPPPQKKNSLQKHRYLVFDIHGIKYALLEWTLQHFTLCMGLWIKHLKGHCHESKATQTNARSAVAIRAEGVVGNF